MKNGDFPFHSGIFDVNHLGKITKKFKNDHYEKLRVYRALFTMVAARHRTLYHNDGILFLVVNFLSENRHSWRGEVVMPRGSTDWGMCVE